MTFKRVRNEIRSVTTGFLSALLILPALASAAPSEANMVERGRQIQQVSAQFDREFPTKEALYRRQLLTALKDLKAVLLYNQQVYNQMRIQHPNLVLLPKDFAKQVTSVADFFFSAYGVDPQGPFVSDLTGVWNDVERSGATAPLKGGENQPKARQAAIELQSKLLKQGEALMNSLLENGTPAIKRKVIDAAANEAAQNPTADVFAISLQKLDQLILSLQPSSKRGPHYLGRNPSISQG